MINDDVVKCALCGGFTHIENGDLLSALQNPTLRQQIENYIATLLKSPVEEFSTVGAIQAGRDFQKDSSAVAEVTMRSGIAREPMDLDTIKSNSNAGWARRIRCHAP